MKAAGLTNLPLHGFARNRVRIAIVALASEFTAWTQMLALAHHEARRRDPNAYGCTCSPSPDASPATPDRSTSDSPPTHPGPS